MAAGAAGAHGEGTSAKGYAATISTIRPNVVGLQLRVVRGDELVLLNLTRSPIVILDRRGRVARTIGAGDSDRWHDPRVVERGDPPPPQPGMPETAPRFVKNWRIPGRVGGAPFVIEGFLGYRPPARRSGGTSSWAYIAAAAVLLAASLGGAYIVGRRDSPGLNP